MLSLMTFRNIFRFFLPGIMGFILQTASAQTGDYKVHAMFVYNFIKYTEWPAGASQGIVGVLNSADATAAIGKVGTGKMQVKNIKITDDLNTCSVIFVPANSNNQLTRLLEKTNGKPVLVVTENADMTKKGACISFKLVQDKLKFQLNQEAIKASGLKISSSLTSLAVN
jgi:YfiR/HmsC-like